MDEIESAVSSAIEERFKRLEPPADVAARLWELVDNWQPEADPERPEQAENC
ncbi:hypothetical protein [Microvirga roseola]|uniref:hypothetical protein n=1 Tax=Microvirga roseola TaxID=2883126 RepID=UPI001E4619BC|nr:hypothetical protein [Microvirga roseola]